MSSPSPRPTPSPQRQATRRGTPIPNYRLLHHGVPIRSERGADAEDIRRELADRRESELMIAARADQQFTHSDDLMVVSDSDEDMEEENEDIVDEDGEEEEGEVNEEPIGPAELQDMDDDLVQHLSNPLVQGFPSMGFMDSGKNYERIRFMGQTDLINRMKKARLISEAAPVCPRGCIYKRGLQKGQAKQLRLRKRSGGRSNTYRCTSCGHSQSVIHHGLDETKSWTSLFSDFPRALSIWAMMLNHTIQIDKYTPGGLGSAAVGGLGRVLRTVCWAYGAIWPFYYDDPEEEVEMDESLILTKRDNGNMEIIRALYAENDPKYLTWNCQYWVFGLIGRKSRVPVFYLVPNRRRPTLIPLINLHIAPEMTVLSDEYSTYRILNEQYEHRTCNHSVNYVEPDGTNTNLIESIWNAVKILIKAKRGIKRDHIFGYLALYAFRKRCEFLGIDPLNAFVWVLTYLWENGVIDADWIREVKGF